MKIRSVEFAGTVADPGAEPPGSLPQVAFSGRSNVGKSSLINILLRRNRQKIAHVSATPGKTQALNFYSVNDKFFLVDLPGYGYAKVPESVREGWRALIQGYIERSSTLRGVVHLLDIRRGPMETDLQMLEYLAALELPVLIAVTKADKLKGGKRARAVEDIVQTLGLDHEQVVACSAKTGEGRDELLGALSDLLATDDDS